MEKVNKSLFPVKTHYFFFMAAMGPILPFLPVIGKQLGVSEVIMGLIMSVIPILFLFAKPIFGFILDYFQSHRKTVFLTLIFSTTLFFSLLQFIPKYKSVPFHPQANCESIHNCTDQITTVEGMDCWVSVEDKTSSTLKLAVNDSYCVEGTIACEPGSVVQVSCSSQGPEFYTSTTFWAFVVLLSAASIGYNVSNSVSDAICFDVLGAGNEKKYGQQRVWGTVGFGLSALVGGYCVDWWSGPGHFKDYTPAYLMAIVFTSIDLLCCTKLKLPVLQKSSNILKDVMKLVRNPSIATFLLFAAFVGICESFIIFFLFWYLEDLAMTTGAMGHIKLLQGLTVASETLVGEIVFFPLSGRILRWVGYRHCLSICFLAYALRLGLLSLVRNPWWAVAVELLQGPSYALSYTTVVAYAAAISPPGTSATIQGVAAGVDDGLGYSVGSLMGGLLYRTLGGSLAFQVFSMFALTCSIVHWLLYIFFFRQSADRAPQTQEKRNIYNPPKEAAEMVVVAS